MNRIRDSKMLLGTWQGLYLFEHRKDPQAWLRLADFQLYVLDDPQKALAALDQALYLDPLSGPIRDSFIKARARLRAQGKLPPEAQQ